ncbi:uncharacterized protein V1516DRAFT_672058 [Lipomyces oligophaga]|uniref:uncharacterized protein n=1 Tax=Lipomyces oligophaga TaxID=45792 RepID=UPI0034CF1047
MTDRRDYDHMCGRFRVFTQGNLSKIDRLNREPASVLQSPGTGRSSQVLTLDDSVGSAPPTRQAQYGQHAGNNVHTNTGGERDGAFYRSMQTGLESNSIISQTLIVNPDLSSPPQTLHEFSDIHSADKLLRQSNLNNSYIIIDQPTSGSHANINMLSSSMPDSQGIQSVEISQRQQVLQASQNSHTSNQQGQAWSSVGRLKSQIELSSRFRVTDAVEASWNISNSDASMKKFRGFLTPFPLPVSEMGRGPTPPARDLMYKFKGVSNTRRNVVKKDSPRKKLKRISTDQHDQQRHS